MPTTPRSPADDTPISGRGLAVVDGAVTHQRFFMSNDADDTDDTLRERLSERLDFMSSTDTDDEPTTEQEADSDTDTGGEAGDADATEQEGDYEDGEDDEDEDDNTEMEMDAGEAVDMLVANTEMDREEAMAFAEAVGAAGGDTEDGGATGDDGEMSAEADVDAAEVAEAAAEAASEVVEQKLDDRLDDIPSRDELEQELNERLESFADTMAEETETTVEQALTGSTPGPNSAGSTDISKDDLFSSDAEGGDNGGD